MWSLVGDELSGAYGCWNDRVYELMGDSGGEVTLVMSAEAEPGPDWSRRAPDVSWAEGHRWELRVPADEVTAVRTVLVETPICGVVFTVQAQREDGCWAVTRSGSVEPALAARLGLERDGDDWTGWVGRDEVVDFIRTPSAETPTPV